MLSTIVKAQENEIQPIKIQAEVRVDYQGEYLDGDNLQQNT